MVVLGILLALAAAVVGVGVIAENSSHTSITLFGQHVPGIDSEGQVFAAGVLVAFVFLLGLAMTVMTTGRALRRRRELRDLREEHQESLTTLEMEKQQLQRELARVRQGGPGGASSAPQVAVERPTVDDVRVAPRQTPSRDAMSSFFDSSGR
jgi:cation transport ATPase